MSPSPAVFSADVEVTAAFGRHGPSSPFFLHQIWSPPPLPARIWLPLGVDHVGHVIPLMELFHYLVDHDFKVTFVNTKFNHNSVIIALSAENTMPQLALVSVPDGLGEKDDRNDLVRQTEALQNTASLLGGTN
ncbi:hypothetical protein ZIOFF_075020 [Zingiber officinale]|uniref:Uncharacterized protein n=1 Tax=Zingiber officinale TaxID=94328 RepID=A0A8J5C137_ZINOF|nr:hypothetical protein ZIOFF_075020 [Zingiber officinale]